MEGLDLPTHAGPMRVEKARVDRGSVPEVDLSPISIIDNYLPVTLRVHIAAKLHLSRIFLLLIEMRLLGFIGS